MTLKVEIISVQGPVFQGQCFMASVPSSLGDIGFMQGHEAVIAELREGKIEIYNENQETIKTVEVKSGTVEMHDGERLLVLIDS